MASDDNAPNSNTPENKPPSEQTENTDFSFKTAEPAQPTLNREGDNASLNPQLLPPKEVSASGSVRNRKKLFIIGSIILVIVAIDFNASQKDQIGGVNAKAKVTFGAVDINTDLSLVATKNETYFKVNNTKQLSQLATVFSGGNKDVTQAFDTLAKKVDNKWIKVDQQGGGVNKCTAALTEAKLSSGDQGNMKKLFENNQFIKAKNAGGSNFSEHHYNLSFDKTAGQKFLKEVMKLDSFKKLKNNCDTDHVADNLKDSNTSKPDQTVKAELWVNRWSHKPTKFLLSVEDKEAKTTVTSTINLGANVTITKPTHSEPLSEVTKEFQEQFLKAIQKQQSIAPVTNPSGMSQAEIDQLLNTTAPR